MDHSPLEDLNFEAALTELEGIVSGMEGGKLPLEASIAAYRRGMALMRHCQALLSDAESQIQVLENGEFRTLEAATPDLPVGTPAQELP